MRAEFLDELSALAALDDRIVLLTADLGFSVIEEFAQRFPDRFFNVGVAEQNLVGIATGLARDGYVPFVYSIATFASMRPYEFIRNGPVLHRLPVRIVGAGGGVDYGHGGVTHFALEDVAILRAQPDLAVVVPATTGQARAAVRASAGHRGPIYFRIARRGATLPVLDGDRLADYGFGRLALVGDDEPEVVFVALGPMAEEAVAASDLLRRSGVRTAVGVVTSFNPFPGDAVWRCTRGTRLVVTVEAHYRVGGLGSAVAEVLAERGSGARLVRKGIPEMPRGYSGSPEYLLRRFGLDADHLAADAQTALAGEMTGASS